MQSSFIQHILEVCKTLNEYSVEYLIIGGTSVGFHGYYRDTTDGLGRVLGKHDFDFWFNPTLENYQNILKAIRALGKDVSRLENESAANPKKSFLRFEFEEFKIDFLPEVTGLKSFGKSFSTKHQSKVNDIIINILSLDDLIAAKEVNPRPKDLEDILQLKRIRDKDK
jgi:hypothetical protein